MLEQIRRLRALVAQQKSDFEAKETAYQTQITTLNASLTELGGVQTELDAFEADLTPAKPTEETPAA